VGLSFLRAHAGLLDKRYGLHIDPRIRHPQDWALGLNPLDTPLSGSSVGAAVTGTLRGNAFRLGKCLLQEGSCRWHGGTADESLRPRS
jgi:hypothetical protein